MSRTTRKMLVDLLYEVLRYSSLGGSQQLINILKTESDYTQRSAMTVSG